jgi:type IV pilus assembly protein PilW
MSNSLIPIAAGRAASIRRNGGMTLVELMVALAISLIIALAAIAALTVSRQGFTTVDAASQLRDNGRYISDLLQRLVGQSGYRDVQYVTRERGSVLGLADNPRPDIFGFNNATIPDTATTCPSANCPLTAATARTAGTVGFGSDILVISYQVSKMFPELAAPAPGWNTADRSVIDCMGQTPATVPGTDAPGDRDLRMISIFHVAVNEGEPTLMCSRSTDNGATFEAAQPVIQGVENLQLLYGVDNVTANAAPGAVGDTVPDSYLRADQLTVGGDPTSVPSFGNWNRVRSVRVGLVLRAKPGTTQARPASTDLIYPFGPSASSNGGANGSALSTTADAGTRMTTPDDGRLRQAMSFTIYLHNQLQN